MMRNKNEKPHPPDWIEPEPGRQYISDEALTPYLHLIPEFYNSLYMDPVTGAELIEDARDVEEYREHIAAQWTEFLEGDPEPFEKKRRLTAYRARLTKQRKEMEGTQEDWDLYWVKRNEDLAARRVYNKQYKQHPTGESGDR